MTEFTPSLHLTKPDFNVSTWHDEVNGNFDIIDSMIYAFTGVTGILGPWVNNTNYVIGNRVIDLVSSRLYEAAVNHTSAAAGTFLQDRTAHPTFWTLISVGIPDPYAVPGDLIVGGNVSIVGSASFGAIDNTPIGQITPADGTFTDLAYTGTLTLLGSPTPTPTIEGRIAWDNNDDNIVVGDGAGTRVFQPSPASTDEHVARYDGSFGRLQNSPVGISDTGNMTGVLTLTATDVRVANEGHFKDIRMVPTAPNPQVSAIYTEADTNLLVVQGGRTASDGAQLLLFGQAHATAPNNISLNSNNVNVYTYDQGSNSHNFLAGSINISSGGVNIAPSGGFSDVNVNVNNAGMQISGGQAFNGGVLRVYGSAHASQASDIEFFSGGLQKYLYDASAAQHQFSNGQAYFADGFRVGNNVTDTPGFGNNNVGICLSAGTSFFSLTSGAGMSINKTADGTNLSFASAGAVEGSVSIAAAVCSYNTFMGSHLGQCSLADRARLSRGMIVESINEKGIWRGEVNHHLPKFKISTDAGSNAVYGVFAWWDLSDKYKDAFIAALGTYMVRLPKGCRVKIGDLIESDGTGYGRVQKDNIIRASTVAKIDMLQVVETFPDGSFNMPATIHCG